jgi:hypothetical protein
MRFLFLIHGDRNGEAALTSDERGAIVLEHVAYADMLREGGAHVLGEALGLAGKVPASPGAAVEVLAIAET